MSAKLLVPLADSRPVWGPARLVLLLVWKWFQAACPPPPRSLSLSPLSARVRGSKLVALLAPFAVLLLVTEDDRGRREESAAGRALLII